MMLASMRGKLLTAAVIPWVSLRGRALTRRSRGLVMFRVARR
jgi:hypothetical protein